MFEITNNLINEEKDFLRDILKGLCVADTQEAREEKALMIMDRLKQLEERQSELPKF